MNVDTGYMGDMDDVLRKAKPGEKVIPAILIPQPRPKPALYGPRKPLREVRKELAEARSSQTSGER